MKWDVYYNETFDVLFLAVPIYVPNEPKLTWAWDWGQGVYRTNLAPQTINCAFIGEFEENYWDQYDNPL